MPDFNIVDIAKAVVPILPLIEKICTGIGVVYEPIHKVRLARAQSETRVIERETERLDALTAAEIEIISQRAAVELEDFKLQFLPSSGLQLTRKQVNCIDIVAKAIPHISSNAPAENVDIDWLSYFIREAEIVSDDQMKTVWANILAEEVSGSNSFSKRTLNFLGTMSRQDAVLFEKLCSFIWHFPEPKLIIFNPRSEIYLRNGISMDVLQHLESIGLIVTTPHVYEYECKEDMFCPSYFGAISKFDYSGRGHMPINIGFVALTAIGKELSCICRSPQIDDYPSFVANVWGFEVLNEADE